MHRIKIEGDVINVGTELHAMPGDRLIVVAGVCVGVVGRVAALEHKRELLAEEEETRPAGELETAEPAPKPTLDEPPNSPKTQILSVFRDYSEWLTSGEITDRLMARYTTLKSEDSFRASLYYALASMRDSGAIKARKRGSRYVYKLA